MDIFNAITTVVKGTFTSLISPAWWAEQLPSFIVFSIFISWLTNKTAEYKERKRNEVFKNWRLRITAMQESLSSEENIPAMQVKDMWDNSFELNNYRLELFFKSKISSKGMKITNIEGAYSSDLSPTGTAWVYADKAARILTIDCRKANSDQAEPRLVPEGSAKSNMPRAT